MAQKQTRILDAGRKLAIIWNNVQTINVQCLINWLIGFSQHSFHINCHANFDVR